MLHHDHLMTSKNTIGIPSHLLLLRDASRVALFRRPDMSGRRCVVFGMRRGKRKAALQVEQPRTIPTQLLHVKIHFVFTGVGSGGYAKRGKGRDQNMFVVSWARSLLIHTTSSPARMDFARNPRQSDPRLRGSDYVCVAYF